MGDGSLGNSYKRMWCLPNLKYVSGTNSNFGVNDAVDDLLRVGSNQYSKRPREKIIDALT